MGANEIGPEMRRSDSLNLEAGKVSSYDGLHQSEPSWKTTLILAVQSLGVVYGDIGTSPLYVFSSTFPEGIKHKDDIIGVLSIIIYTLILVPIVKYVSIVLHANDNGEGGTFAMYSLICRHAKVSLIPNSHPEDTNLSNYKWDTSSSKLKRSEEIKKKLETSRVLPYVPFVITIVGTSMVIGDGILTPCISVLSAVYGLQGGIKSLDQSAVAWISVAVLVLLFSVQKFGTDKVGFTFAPIILLWFLFLSGIGIYNLVTYDITVLKAFNPWYIFKYFQNNGGHAWISLGGAVLCVTGAEAMFADLGHLSVRAIQISFSCITFPTLLVAYLGQSAYLTKNPGDVSTAFYASIPIVSVMCITTCMITLIMTVIWKTSFVLIALFFVVFISIEGVYLSSVLFKFADGGYFPLCFAAFLMAVMATWHYVQKKCYYFEVQNMVSHEYIKQFASTPNVHRIPGMALLYSDLVNGIPPIFSHFIANIPSVHSVVVMVTIKPLPVSKVTAEERFVFRQLESKEYVMFRCVARYGYNDMVEKPREFEEMLVNNLKEFVRCKYVISEGNLMKDGYKEIGFIQEAMETGVVYLLGETAVEAEEKSSWFKKLVVNYLYDFLRKNSRQSGKIMSIPRKKLLMVGMTYDI